jgi:hypothetical protein
VIRVARAHALQEGDPLRLASVAGTQDVPGVGPRSRQQALELEGGHHVREAAVAELGLEARVEGLVPGRQHDRADLELEPLLALAVVDGVGETHVGAPVAVAADRATQAAGGLGPGLLLGVAGVDLVEGARACRRGQLG